MHIVRYSVPAQASVVIRCMLCSDWRCFCVARFSTVCMLRNRSAPPPTGQPALFFVTSSHFISNVFTRQQLDVVAERCRRLRCFFCCTVQTCRRMSSSASRARNAADTSPRLGWCRASSGRFCSRLSQLLRFGCSVE